MPMPETDSEVAGVRFRDLYLNKNFRRLLQRWSNKHTLSVDEDVEKREHLCTVGGIVNWFSHYGEQYGASSKD